MSPTDVVALAPPTKSPPALAQSWVLKTLSDHVASPMVAGAPPPSFVAGSDVPSPQSSVRRCSERVFAPDRVLDNSSVSVALVIVDPPGMLPGSN